MLYARREPSGAFTLLIGVAVALGVACGQREELLGPDTGALSVVVRSTGQSLDPDGYVIRLDEDDPVSLGVNATVDLPRITPGAHALTLAGLASNCTVGGGNPRSVTVFADDTSEVRFDVACPTPLGTGALVVTVATSGATPDPDGYSVVADPAPSQPAGVSDRVVFGDLSAGDHLLRLSGVAANCFADGENPRSVTIPNADTARTAFTVTCWPPPTGRIAFIREGDNFDLYLINGDGTGLTNLSSAYAELGFSLGSAGGPSWSPDGERVAISSFDETDFSTSIILVAVDTASHTPPEPVVGGAGFPFCPAWSPDGRAIAFEADTSVADSSFRTLGVIDLATRRQRTLVVASDTMSIHGCPSWSPDGKHIAFAVARIDPAFVGDVVMVDTDGSNLTSLLGGLPNQFIESATWSPDGTRLAIVTDRGPDVFEEDVFAVTLATGSRVAVTGGRFDLVTEPAWSPDGTRIVFRADFHLFVVNSDGSGMVPLTLAVADRFDSEPAWGPAP